MTVRGVRPAEYLFQHDFLSPRLVAAHCRFMTPGEIAHLGRSRVSVSHNAAMAARRAAAPPVLALQAAGCRIAMGTDNMAHDMLEAMCTGLFVERISRQDGERPWPEDVLEWGTRNGAAALGPGADVGSLEVGKKADLIVLDARRPHLVPALRIVSGWIHNGQAGDVESVMVDGRWLMRDRNVLTIDEADVVTRRGDRATCVATAGGTLPERSVPDHAAAAGPHEPSGSDRAYRFLFIVTIEVLAPAIPYRTIRRPVHQREDILGDVVRTGLQLRLVRATPSNRTSSSALFGSGAVVGARIVRASSEGSRSTNVGGRPPTASTTSLQAIPAVRLWLSSTGPLRRATLVVCRRCYTASDHHASRAADRAMCVCVVTRGDTLQHIVLQPT